MSTDELIQRIAGHYALPFPLVKAIIQVESGNDFHAWRAEPPYRYLVDVRTRRPFRKLTAEETVSETAPPDFPYFLGLSSRDTEWWGQQSSWGSMQIMGAVAREYGYTGHFPGLCTIKGVEFGCEHLSRLVKRYALGRDLRPAIAAYNAGSPRYRHENEFVNQYYVDRVIQAGGLT